MPKHTPKRVTPARKNTNRLAPICEHTFKIEDRVTFTHNLPLKRTRYAYRVYQRTGIIKKIDHSHTGPFARVLLPSRHYVRVALNRLQPARDMAGANISRPDAL